MNAAIYARISEDREETQLGVQRQIEDCEQLCAKRVWPVAKIYTDNDVSAYTGKVRPAYQEMLGDIATGRVTAVVVWHQDRLVRQPRELEEFFDICDKAGLTSLASVAGDVDLATHDGRLKARIMGAVARNQSDAASRRIRRKMEEIAKAGGPKGGGTRPFGFEEDRVTLRPDEVAVIREMVDRLLAGEPIRSLCRDLNARGIRTSTGGPWLPQPMRRLLRSARIAGQREHRGVVVAKAIWPAIIEPEQGRLIRAILDDPSRRTTRTPQRYPLKGLVRCSHCNAVLVARPREDGARRYICASGNGFAGCGKTYVLAETLEEFVTEAVLWRLDSPELADAISGKQTGDRVAMYDEADALTAKLDELADSYAADEISMREWMRVREPVQRRLDSARRQIARSSHALAMIDHVGRGDALRKEWPALDLDRRHAIISAVLSHVIAGPGRRGYNRFDPSRFQLVWRH